MRNVRDLTPDERGAYNVWRSKLADRTLSAAQHDECRRQIDELLWKGPNSQVLALRAELTAVRSDLANMAARLDRVEFHAGLNDDAYLDAPPRVGAGGNDGPGVTTTVEDLPAGHSEPPRLFKPAPKVVNADCGNSLGLVDEVTPTVDAPQVTNSEEANAPSDPPSQRTGGAGQTAEPKVETRGRKKLRFIPEKHPQGGWMILDRGVNGTGTEWVQTAPFGKRKDAKAITDDLNAGILPKFLKGVHIPDWECVGPDEDHGDKGFVAAVAGSIGTPIPGSTSYVEPVAEQEPDDQDDPLADLGF